MKTNFEMVKELVGNYTPTTYGIVTGEEVEIIKETLQLSKMDLTQLRNMRDFVVLFLGKSEKIEDWDRMSAIVSVIDSTIFEMGGEV